MATSMLDAVTQLITPTLASRLGSSYGDSPSAVTKGLAATIPTILGMVTSRSSDPGFMSQVYALARDPGNDPTLVDDPNRVVDRVALPARNGPVERFRSLILGAGSTRLLDAIASYAGVQSSTASSILSAAVPLVLGYLGRMVRQDGLDSAGLRRRLAAENQAVFSAIPAAFSGVLSGGAGLATDATRMGARADASGWDAVDHAAEVADANLKRSAAWPWVTTMLVLAALWGAFALISRRSMTEQAETAVGTAGEYATLMLPTGVNLRVPPAGSEAKLLAYASGAPLSADTWVEFDRLTFETDSGTLTSDSHEQLSATADILKAYPAVHLEIGGYTDNSGDPAANLMLSQERATSVMNELVSMGVGADRLEAEGYGGEHPIATNVTEEGRAQNRRVAFRVTAR